MFKVYGVCGDRWCIFVKPGPASPLHMIGTVTVPWKSKFKINVQH
jgi:hypothetical protein